MNLFNASLPFSYAGLSIIFILGIALTTLVFGVISSAFIIICMYCGIIRISPILEALGSCISYFNPGVLESIQANLRESLDVEYRDDISEGKHIFLFHPHGAFSIANMLHVGTTLTNWKYRPIKGTILNKLFWLPFAKEILDALNFVPSNYDTMKSVIEEGHSLTICLGGVKEILYTEANTMKLSIKNKKGAFRLALETGAPLVPVVSYGENELFELSKHSWLEPIQQILIHYGLYLPVPTIKSCKSWFGIPWTPLKNPIRTVVGKPIKVVQIDEPTEKDIIDLRETYFKALNDLYNETKPKSYTDDLKIV